MLEGRNADEQQSLLRIKAARFLQVLSVLWRKPKKRKNPSQPCRFLGQGWRNGSLSWGEELGRNYDCKPCWEREELQKQNRINNG